AFWVSCSFFFQAEDGIRDFHVTGVQTCALPIFWVVPPRNCEDTTVAGMQFCPPVGSSVTSIVSGRKAITNSPVSERSSSRFASRSEERRVGKERRSRRWPGH